MIQTDNKNYSKLSQYQGKENDNKIIIVSDKNQKEYRDTSNELRNYWEIGKNAAAKVNKILNKLIAILHEEHPSWSITKIAYTIWVQHEDLEGFSRPTIVSKLDNDNRKLLHNKGGKRLPTKSNNIKIEKSSNNVDDRVSLRNADQIKNAESATVIENNANEIIKEFPKQTAEEYTLNESLKENDTYLTPHNELQITKQLLQEARETIGELNLKIQDLSLNKITPPSLVLENNSNEVIKGTAYLEFGSETIDDIKVEYNNITKRFYLKVDESIVKAFYTKVYNE